MSELPTIALSVRQPWAWAIIHGGKDIENRSWRSDNPGVRFRGDFCVHAASGMTKAEYEDAADTMAFLGVECPPPAELLRGGIIGVATVADIVTDHASGWFFGPKGLLLTRARAVEFVGVGGQLGFFKWWQDGPRPPPIEAVKWMREWGQDAPLKPEQIDAFGPPAPLSPLDRLYAKARSP